MSRATLPRIALLTTGGTIMATARAPDATTGYAIADDAPDLHPALAAPLSALARITPIPFARLPSTDVGAAQLLDLARQLNALMAAPEIDGVVVTHGTDTLEETALFLDLTVATAKPLVLTGAMRPADTLGSDAHRNLLDAVRVATTPAAAASGVLVVMDEQVIAAHAVAKHHTTALSAFRPMGEDLAGRIVDDRVRLRAPHRHGVAFDVGAIGTLASVDIVYAHQDLGLHLFDAVIAGGARGLVLACTGNGSLSATGRIAVGRALAHGIVVVRSTRVGNGDVGWEQLPGLPSGSLNPQKSRILLMLALAQSDDPRRVAEIFRSSCRLIDGISQ